MAQYGGQWLAAIRRRLICFHMQGTRNAAAMTQDEIAVLVQDSLAPNASASGLNADRVQRDGYRSALPGWPAGSWPPSRSTACARGWTPAKSVRPASTLLDASSTARIAWMPISIACSGPSTSPTPLKSTLLRSATNSLAPVNLRYLKIYRNQRGKLVARYRRGGFSRRLPTDDGSPCRTGRLSVADGGLATGSSRPRTGAVPPRAEGRARRSAYTPPGRAGRGVDRCADHPDATWNAT